MTKSTKIIYIFSILIIAYFIFENYLSNKPIVSEVEDEVYITEPKDIVVETQSKIVNNSVVIADNNQKAKAETKVQVIDAVGFIQDIRLFLDNSDVKNLSQINKISLAQSLQSCGTVPRHDADALEQNQHYQYFGNPELTPYENWNKWVDMCNKVTDEEILMSYQLLLEVAMTGDFSAINALPYAQSEIALQASMNNDWENIDLDELRKKHADIMYPLLERSIEDGNIKAALNIAHDYNKGILLEKNTIKSLGYYMAVKEVLKTDKYNNIIKILSNDHLELEIDDAKSIASHLVMKWNLLTHIYY